MTSWLDMLEGAQREVARAAALFRGDFRPSIDLTPAARGVERALSGIFDAFDERAPRLEAVQRAGDELRAAQAVLAGETWPIPALQASGEALARASELIGAAQRVLETLPVTPSLEIERELSASGETPRLHHVARASLIPEVTVPSPPPLPPGRPNRLPKATTFAQLHANVAELDRRSLARELERQADQAHEELEALRAVKATQAAAPPPPPPGFDVDMRPQMSELAFVRDRVRFHFEEVAMLGMQRAPMFGDRWRDVLTLEQRMLRAIDAIASMGPEALRWLEPLVRDAPAKDATRVFAITMVLGCMSGRDALAAAERVFFEFEKTDECSRATFADALKLVPHDHLHVLLHSLLRDPDPHHRAVAIDVLAHRGLASEEQLLTAAADAPEVAEKALPHLALVAPRRSGALVDQALASPGVNRRAVWLAMALSQHGGTRMTLAEALGDAEAGGMAALLLALAGDRNDGALLLEHVVAAPSPACVDALGWVGDPQAFAPLLQLLDHEDEEVGWAAGHALDRITGAWLVEHVNLEAEEIYVEIPPDPKVGFGDEQRLPRTVSDPRDLPPDPSKETIERPSRDPARWSAWIAEHGGEMRAGRRFRRGRPYLPRTSLAELDTSPCLLPERQALGWELVIRTGSHVRFSPHDFVRIQEEALDEWRPLADKSVTPGTWDRPGRR